MKLNRLLRLGDAIEKLAEILEVDPLTIVDLLTTEIFDHKEAEELRNYFEDYTK